jgi:hypothetical protein
MYLGSYVNSASGLKISWNTAEPFIDSKMKSLPAKALDIINLWWLVLWLIIAFDDNSILLIFKLNKLPADINSAINAGP